MTRFLSSPVTTVVFGYQMKAFTERLKLSWVKMYLKSLAEPSATRCFSGLQTNFLLCFTGDQ